MQKDSRIYVAGHRGLVGAAIVRALESEGYSNLLLYDRNRLDLRDYHAVDEFFRAEQPTHVFLAAARVGGILANKTYPADFIRDNLQIQTNVIDRSWKYNAEKLLFLGSSCIYPKLAPQPIKEEYLLSGPLEPTNEAYAIAKIAGIQMCQAYALQHGFRAISLMPANLYGPGDNFDLQNSHVLPALIRRFHEARLNGDREVVVWGSGTPRREFLHVDDLASAALFAMKTYESPAILNVGAGTDLTIRQLAATIRDIVGCEAGIVFDSSKPDGTPRKLLDVTRMAALGWKARIPLEEGLRSTYRWFIECEHPRTGTPA